MSDKPINAKHYPIDIRHYLVPTNDKTLTYKPTGNLPEVKWRKL